MNILPRVRGTVRTFSGAHRDAIFLIASAVRSITLIIAGILGPGRPEVIITCAVTNLAVEYLVLRLTS